MKKRSKKQNRAVFKHNERTAQRHTAQRHAVQRHTSQDRSAVRHCAAPESDAVIGIFTSSGRGFGFVRPDSYLEATNGEDIFIPARAVHGAESGDTVRAVLRPSYYDRGTHKTEGEIISIEKRSSLPICGRLEESPIITRRGGKPCTKSSFLCFADDEARLSFPVRISEAKAHGAAHGERVAIKLLAYPERGKEAIGEVVERFGSALDPRSSVRAVIYSSGAPTEFSAEALAEAESAAAVPAAAEGRVDLRGKTIFTIDSEYARDLDDAISVDATENGWLLGVHIADVSEYVRENSTLDLEARSRGNSIYYPGAVIPMLPEALSNFACSLNADSAKLTLSAFVSIDREGKLCACRFCESIISSAARGVYRELNAVLDGSAEPEILKKYPPAVLASLREAVKLYKVLEARSKARGAFELAESDAVIKLDDDSTPIEIAREVRGTTERLIEQFMLCANEAAARVTNALSLPGVYRIHEPPDPEKITAFLDFASRLGLDVRSAGIRADAINGKDISRLLALAEEKDCAGIVSKLLLRSLMKAKYDTEARGHFGLALEYYSHFTSPIRRYSDLALHRELKRALRRGTALELDIKNTPASEPKASKITSPAVAAACVSANEGELRALEIERTADDIYKAVYMSRFVGDEFAATVSAVASFGIFVELENTCEGLVPASAFDDWCDYDRDNLTFTCGETVYTPGAPVRVKLISTDTARGKLTFELADD